MVKNAHCLDEAVFFSETFEIATPGQLNQRCVQVIMSKLSRAVKIEILIQKHLLFAFDLAGE